MPLSEVPNSSSPQASPPTSEADAVLRFVKHEQGSLFVTGRAGTGKSTLLRKIVDTLDGRVVIAAPTGLAALNVGGETLHSLFRLPYGLLVGGDEHRASPRDVFDVEDVTLVIDEVSMVRADVMNAMDLSLRRRRKSAEPFGGVRVIAFGDTHQLPPVVPRDEVEELRQALGGRFFFHAPGAQSMRVMDLMTVHRQKDLEFVGALNEIREGVASSASLEIVNSRVGSIARHEISRWSWLCPTNSDADAINRQCLADLTGPASYFHAEVSGDFASERTLPVERALVVKEGARVIFVRNDRQRRWMNGTTGVVTSVTGNEVDVSIDGGDTVTVTPETWTKVKRVKTGDEISEVEAGRLMQLPLRLGWALSVHKSQGMTLDKVCFALRAPLFDSGQAYVALSRARSLGGLRLLRALTPRDIFLAPEAKQYRTMLTRLVNDPRGASGSKNVVPLHRVGAT